MLFEFENANERNYIIANLTFVPKNYTIACHITYLFVQLHACVITYKPSFFFVTSLINLFSV